MSKATKSLVFFFTCEMLWCIILYAAWSFVLWDGDPTNWTEDARFGIVFWGLGLGLILSTLAVNVSREND